MQKEDSYIDESQHQFQKKENCQSILDNLFNPDLALSHNTEESNKKLLEQKIRDQKQIATNDSCMRFDSLQSFF